MRNFRAEFDTLPHAEERPQSCPRLELGRISKHAPQQCSGDFLRNYEKNEMEKEQ
jgi:hypothetical protein